MEAARLENITGALALALSDGLLRAAQGEVPANISAAGLSLVGHAPGITVHELSRALGMSHPGTVRLVDRMVAAGFVERARSQTDGRAVALRLTESGEAGERSIHASRQSVVSAALSSLSDMDRETFGQLADKLLRAIVEDDEHAATICRLCDGVACTDCPVETELIGRASGSI